MDLLDDGMDDESEKETETEREHRGEEMERDEEKLKSYLRDAGSSLEAFLKDVEGGQVIVSACRNTDKEEESEIEVNNNEIKNEINNFKGKDCLIDLLLKAESISAPHTKLKPPMKRRKAERRRRQWEKAMASATHEGPSTINNNSSSSSTSWFSWLIPGCMRGDVDRFDNNNYHGVGGSEPT